MSVWRSDFNSQDHTANNVSIEAVDKRVIETRHFYLYINHVRGINGKGFMCSIISTLSGEISKNGSLHYGIDSEAYDKTLNEGKYYLKKLQKEFEELAASMDERL